MSESRPSVPLARPSFGKQEEEAVAAVLRSGWVAQGPRVAEFERRVAEMVGVDFAIATSSATTALFLSMRGLGIGPGDEVIVPAATFIASVNSVVHTGATPVLVDVDPRTYNIVPERIASAVGPRTRAVMIVHQLGLPAELDEIEAIATERGLEIIEDSACALGSSYRGRPIGSSGHLNCFSFHARKVVVTGEGGMITTANEELAERLRRLRQQGMSISAHDRQRDDRVITERYDEVGYNCRMSDLHAAVGVVQLDRLPELAARRRSLAARYDAALAADPIVVTPWVPEHVETTYQSYIIRLRGFAASERDRVLDAMQRRGVTTRRGLMAVQREQAYRDACIRGSLASAEKVDDESVVLPMFGDLGDEDQDYVVAMLQESIREVRSSA